MSKWQDDDAYTFTNNITNRIQSIIYLATVQRDVTIMCEDLLSSLDKYMSPDVKRFRDNNAAYDINMGDEYVKNLHRVRTVSLTLYNIEVIPSPAVNISRLKFSDVMNDIKAKSVSQSIDYRRTMMYYLEARRSLTERMLTKPETVSNPHHAIHFLLDIGFSLLAPYTLSEEYDMWETACSQIANCENKVDNPDIMNRARKNKMILQSKIMHRQHFQLSYRDIDKMGYKPDQDEIISEYKEYKDLV